MSVQILLHNFWTPKVMGVHPTHLAFPDGEKRVMAALIERD